MAPVVVSARELKEAVERRAYAYGISETVSILLGEYVVDLIKNLYAKSTEQLVQDPVR
ncbi:hypothetical protein HY733_02890 [Candidatus Uhrbacteria bacterium]|nr:hypothetical protein [Candidatus Uhrbacteria bacterium]